MIRTRVSELLGVNYPIVQAPMGWIARSALVSAMSNAGGLGTSEKPPPAEPIVGEFRRALDLYFGGDMEASIALPGQVAGRIHSVNPVAEIVRETAAEFETVAAEMGARFGTRRPPASFG